VEKQTETGLPPRRATSRRDFLKTSAKWGLGLLGLAAAGGSYATVLEPRWLEVVRSRIELPDLPPAFRGARVAHFSDVHFDFYFGADRLRGLVRKIQDEEPDMILFTGDLVDSSMGNAGNQVSEILGKLQAPLGQYAVLGNHDYFDNARDVAEALANGGFRVLRNESELVHRGGQTIRIAGVEDYSRGKPNLSNALKAAQDEECVLLLAHIPDFAAQALAFPVSLQLSGHSHGGQVRLPFAGPVVRVPGAKLYPDGLCRPGGGKLQLYTNRGIGVTGLPIRFLCRPELTIHTLV
jgi:predicted MPP superfamily phosphohydrolase